MEVYSFYHSIHKNYPVCEKFLLKCILYFSVFSKWWAGCNSAFHWWQPVSTVTLGEARLFLVQPGLVPPRAHLHFLLWLPAYCFNIVLCGSTLPLFSSRFMDVDMAKNHVKNLKQERKYRMTAGKSPAHFAVHTPTNGEGPYIWGGGEDAPWMKSEQLMSQWISPLFALCLT